MQLPLGLLSSPCTTYVQSVLSGPPPLLQLQLKLQYLARQSRATHKGASGSWITGTKPSLALSPVVQAWPAGDAGQGQQPATGQGAVCGAIRHCQGKYAASNPNLACGLCTCELYATPLLRYTACVFCPCFDAHSPGEYWQHIFVRGLW
jgi:hypothetical protein